MATTYNDNGGAVNGSNLEYTFSFPYLKTEDVKVSLNGLIQAATKYTVSTSPSKITFNNTSVDSSVQESTGAPKTGVEVRVYRDTEVDTAKAVYSVGSSIRAGDLNDNMDQVLYALQEQQSDTVDTHRITDKSVVNDKIRDTTITSAKLVKPIDLADDEKIRLGTGNDLQIWHEGSSGNSFITSGTTGQLQIKVNNTEASIVCIPDGSTSLYHDSSKKISTLSTGAEITGNIVVSGTVDGRDVAADGTKLDAIESGATADQTGAQIKTLYEAESDTNAYTDAEKTKLSGIAAGAEVNVQSDWNSSSGDNQILNKPTLVSGINDLSDVDTTGVANDKILKYVAADSKWKIADDGGGSGGGSSITVQDEGSALSTAATTLNFTGAGVTASGTGATKTVNIPGSSGGASAFTGLSDTPNSLGSAGQHLKVNSSGNALEFTDAPSGTTNLSNTANGTSLTVESSSGTNTALPAATTSAWGVMTDDDKTKLDGIATGAEVNVQSDWNASSGDAQILNKPTIPSGTPEGTAVLSTGVTGTAKFLRVNGDDSCSWQVPPDTTYSVGDGGLTQNNFTNTLKTKLDGIAVSANNYAISADLLDEDDMATNSATKVASQQSIKAYADTKGAVADSCIYKNSLTISNNHTIAATEGAHSVGPITNNATVTVNGRWVIS